MINHLIGITSEFNINFVKRFNVVGGEGYRYHKDSFLFRFCDYVRSRWSEPFCSLRSNFTLPCQGTLMTQSGFLQNFFDSIYRPLDFLVIFIPFLKAVGFREAVCRIDDATPLYY